MEFKSYNGDNDYYPKRLGKLEYPEEPSDWDNIKKNLNKVVEKSEDDFEKYLNIFGSGGLLVGLTILSQLIDKNIFYICQWLLTSGTVLFLICLISNLLSHYLVISYNRKSIYEYESGVQSIWDHFKKRNQNIKNLNRLSIFSIIFGTIFIILFLTINLNNMADQNKKPQNQPDTKQGNPIRQGDTKGRVAPQPTVVKPPKTK